MDPSFRKHTRPSRWRSGTQKREPMPARHRSEKPRSAYHRSCVPLSPRLRQVVRQCRPHVLRGRGKGREATSAFPAFPLSAGTGCHLRPRCSKERPRKIATQGAPDADQHPRRQDRPAQPRHPHLRQRQARAARRGHDLGLQFRLHPGRRRVGGPSHGEGRRSLPARARRAPL